MPTARVRAQKSTMPERAFASRAQRLLSQLDLDLHAARTAAAPQVTHDKDYSVGVFSLRFRSRDVEDWYIESRAKVTHQTFVWFCAIQFGGHVLMSLLSYACFVVSVVWSPMLMVATCVVIPVAGACKDAASAVVLRERLWLALLTGGFSVQRGLIQCGVAPPLNSLAMRSYVVFMCMDVCFLHYINCSHFTVVFNNVVILLACVGDVLVPNSGKPISEMDSSKKNIPNPARLWPVPLTEGLISRSCRASH